ncbi:hypothetical protein D3C85_1575270 [compost metagenome]
MIEVTSDNKKLNINAHQNPSTLNPSISFAPHIIINALITKRNNPRVMIVTGNVRITKMGLIIMLRSPKTTATINAVPNVSI